MSNFDNIFNFDELFWRIGNICFILTNPNPVYVFWAKCGQVCSSVYQFALVLFWQIYIEITGLFAIRKLITDLYAKLNFIFSRGNVMGIFTLI